MSMSSPIIATDKLVQIQMRGELGCRTQCTIIDYDEHGLTYERLGRKIYAPWTSIQEVQAT